MISSCQWVLFLQSQSRSFFFVYSINFKKLTSFHERETAGSIYHQQIADDLIKKLPNILKLTGGMMSIEEVYCLYNRARGINLISPGNPCFIEIFFFQKK